MAKNRWELEENRKKKAQEAIKQAIQSGAAYKGATPQQVTQAVTGNKTTSKSSVGRSSGKTSSGTSRGASSRGSSQRTTSTRDTRPQGARIPTFLQPKTTTHKLRPILRTASGYSLPAITGTTRAERQSDLDRLQANSIAWHFADDAQKESLFQENNEIRKKYGLNYVPESGITVGQGGENFSENVPEGVAREQSYNEQTPLTVFGYNTLSAVEGVNEAFYKTLDFLLPDVITPKPVQEFINDAKENAENFQEEVRNYNYSRGGMVGGIVGDLYQAALSSVPQVVLTLLSGSTSTAAQLGSEASSLISTISQQLTKNAGYLTSFLSTVGIDYERAKANGASDTEAALSAILSSAATAGIETAGGIDVPAQSTSRLRNAVRTALEEGGEEVLQGATQRATQAFYDPSVTLSDITDPASMAQDFGGGALLGGVTGLTRRPAQANAETPLAGINEDIDVRNSWTQENSNALPTGEVPLLPAGTPAPRRTMYAGQTGVSSGRGNINTAPETGVLYGGTRGRLYPTLPGRTSSVTTPDVLYAAQNGQVSASLPTGLLPQGRNQQTRIGARVNSVDTYPVLAAVDDAGNTNGGLTNQQIGFVQELYNAQQKTGIPAREIANEIVAPVMQKYDAVLQSTEQYIRDYKGQGTVVVGTDEYGRGGYRSSQNDPWYSDFYAENGRAPRKSEAAGLAKTLVDGEIARGGGQFVTPEFAESYKVASDVQTAMEALGEDVLNVQATADGIQVSRGTPARTANLQDTNAGRAFVSPVTQSEPQSPLNTTPITPQLQTAQQAAGTAVNSRNIAPELRTAQPSVQRPATQRVQPTLQTASENVPQSSPESSVGAAQSNFDPYTHMENEYGTIEPGENPARIVDVPVSTDGSDRVRRFARTAMEASATPDEMIPEFERNVANGLFSYNPRSDQDSLNKATQTITQKGYDGALAQWEDVTSGRRTANKDDIVLAQMLYSEAAKVGDTQLAMQLAAEIAAEGTRAGQNVQALRLLKRTTPEGKLYYIRKAVDNIQNDLNKARGKKAPQIEIDETLAQGLVDAQTDADANAAMDAIYDDVANQIPSTFGDRLNAWRYFAMLGNPRTHIRNVIGNIVYQIPTRVSNKISATLQKALPQEKRTRSVTRNRVAKDFAKADYENMKNVISGDAYTSEMTEVQRRQRLYPKPLQAVMDLNSKALDAEDQLFKRTTYINSMADFLTARGVDMNNINPDVLEQARTHAIEDAKKATFQDASALADAIGKIENKNKATKLVIGGLLPFKRTPINIAKRGFELSPLGLIKGLTVDLNKVRNGTMTATDAIDHISQGLTGTSLAVLGYFLASNGILTASNPENDKERNFEAAQGSQEYAINIGPYSYTIDWAAPAALPMFVGAEFYNALTAKYDDEEQAFKQATDALSRLFEPMINMTMLSGISSTIQSATYSQTNPLFAIAGNIAQNYAGQVVPTLSGQIARTIDDTRRTTYADKDSWVPDSIQTFMQRQANKIPGLSQNQPAYTDVWGRPDTTENGWLRAFENFLSPGYIGNRTSSDAENALRELYNTTGDTAVLPSKPQKTYTIDGVEHNLTADQWLRLSNAKGQTALNAITALTQSGAYQSMSDQEKVNAVKDVYDYASAVAANQVYNKELEGTIKTVHDSGIDPGLYYAYKEMEDTLNESVEGYEARDQVFNTIRSDSSLTEEQKNQLYHTLLIQGTSDSQWEKYQEISDTVTAEEYVDAMIQSQAIKAYGDTLEEGRATAEATEFSYYLDAMGYDDTKRSALEDTFKFYNMFPAEPSNYTFDMMRENGSQREKDNVDAIEASGLSAAQYMQIKTLTSDATWTKGETGAKLKAYGKIVSENTENYDQYAAVMHALGYKNIDGAYTGSGTLPDVQTGTSQVQRGDTAEEVGINPVAAGPGVRLGSTYGYREAPTAGASTFHEGNDIPAPMGTPVVAYKSGTVSFVGDSGSGGNMVQIDHPDGTKSVYLHLQDGSFQVSPGQTVSQGQQIANVGSTGISTGPHLDFRIMVNGKYVDPQTYYPGY